jgi:hypothetical protein
MPVKNVTVSTRPSTDHPFWNFSQTIKDYIKVNYRDTGKVLSGITEISSDNLTRTRTVIWRDEDSQDEFLTDPVIRQAFLERRAYQKLHGQESTYTNTIVSLEIEE